MTESYSNVNNSAVIVESRETLVDAPAEKVIETLKGVDTWSDWNTSVSNASIDGTFAAGSKFKWDTESGTISSQIKIVQSDKIVWVGKTLGIFAIHEWNFEKIGDKTKVTSKESWEGLTVITLQSLLRGQLGDSLDTMLNDLKLEAEKK